MTVAPVYNSKGSLGIGALSVAAPLGQVANAVPPRRRPVGFQGFRAGQLRVGPVVDKSRELVADLGIRPAEVTDKLPVGLGQGEIGRQPMRVARVRRVIFTPFRGSSITTYGIRLSRSCVTPVTRDRGVVTAVTRDIRDIIAVLPLALGILGPLAFKSGLMLAILSGTLSFDRR
jgi:hypothetical protein